MLDIVADFILHSNVFDKLYLKNGWSHYNEIHSTLNEIMTLQIKSGISEAMSLQFFCFFGRKIYEKLKNFHSPFYS